MLNVQPVSNLFERPCPRCATQWVDQATCVAGLHLENAERRQLIAGLLARRHLIVSGPDGSGKRRLIKALSIAMALDRSDHVFFLQGHPWWAAGTGNVTRFVDMQTEFSLWRLNDFVESLSAEQRNQSVLHTKEQVSPYVVCVERMSPAEIDLYFGGAVQWLCRQQIRGVMPASLRFAGTFDGDRAPLLGAAILRATALVHLGGTPRIPTESEVSAQDPER